jgi:hypothetical protein
MAYIYALHFKDDFGVYIGCTRSNVAKRLREHRCLLKSGKHTCRELQDRWDRVHGDLAVYVMSECADDLPSRRAAELAAMDKVGDALINDRFSFRPTEDAWRKGVEASRFVEGNKRSAEANLKRSLAQKGKPKGHGAKISATKQARKLEQVMR